MQRALGIAGAGTAAEIASLGFWQSETRHISLQIGGRRLEASIAGCFAPSAPPVRIVKTEEKHQVLGSNIKASVCIVIHCLYIKSASLHT